MKTKFKLKKALPFAGMAALVFGILLFSQCKKEDVVEVLTNTNTYGTDVIDNITGDYSAESHSRVTWWTNYHADGMMLLTGGFNNYSADIHFDEANPAAFTLAANVQLQSINTFNPGRDGLGHCVADDLGIVHNGDTLADGSLDPAGADPLTDYAYLDVTGCVRYGDGYKADGTFTFLGKTITVDFYFRYLGGEEIVGKSSTSIYSGFEGEFDFKPLTDFGMEYSGDDICHVKIHQQFKKPV